MQEQEEVEEYDLFTVDPEEAGQRLDLLLTKHYQGRQSRRYFQRLIQDDKVLVNGQSVNKKDRMQVGDIVAVTFVLAPELTLEPENLPLDILWEDDHMVVLNKVAGQVVHPAPGNWKGTVANALAYHLGRIESAGDQLRPGIVHRLDKDTSGLLVVAKNLQAHHRLVSLFAARNVSKYYLAMTCGHPKEGEIDAPIGRHPKLRKEMTVDEQRGRPAKTINRTLAFKESLALVELKLITGRTHQIRVHLKHLGFPILGDTVYGSHSLNKRWGARRQLLHAHRLKLPHPITGEPLSFIAPLPEDMIRLIDKHLPGVSIPCESSYNA